MSNVKISALPTGTIAVTDTVPVVKAGVTTAVPFAHTHLSSQVSGSFPTTQIAGTFGSSSLGTGTATSTTFLRGDQIYTDIGTIASGTFFPGITVTPLNQASWGWINQSGASVTQGANTVYLDSTAIGTGIHARTVTAPSTPYTITTLMRGVYYDTVASHSYAGITFRDLGGKLECFYVSGAQQFQMVQFTSPTAFSAAPLNTALVGAAGNFQWLRIADDGVNLTFSHSLDGINFFAAYSEARNSFFTTGVGPQQVGIFVAADAGTTRVSATYFSWTSS